MATEVSELPDYMKDPNVVLLDNVEWANGTPPDYSVVNQLYEKGVKKHISRPYNCIAIIIITNHKENYNYVLQRKARAMLQAPWKIWSPT